MQAYEEAPAEATDLCLVRHGESEWNREGLIQGHADPGLSAAGRLQAAAVASLLAAESWDFLFSSDLARALQTAATIAGRIGCSICRRVDLRERYLGKLQGAPAPEARLRYPSWDVPELQCEPMAQFRQRSIAALTDIAAAAKGRRAVVVTHGGLIRALHWYLREHGYEPARNEIPVVTNASITRVLWQPTRPRLLSVQEVATQESAG